MICFSSAPPGIEGEEIENVEVIENHTVYLSCPASGIPTPSIIWYRNQMPLFDSPYTNMREMDGGHTLELRHVQVSDEAVYKCQANNVAGQQTKSFNVSVLSM